MIYEYNINSIKKLYCIQYSFHLKVTEILYGSI